MDWRRGEIDRLFEHFSRPASSSVSFGNRSPAAPVPAVELVDDDKAYRLTAELPGLSEQDIAVSIADGVLDISGEKKEESERKDKGYLYSERRYGSFHRQVSLPSDVDQRSEEHTSELQSLMRSSYAVFCLKKKQKQKYHSN